MSLQNENLTSIYKLRAVDFGGYIDLSTLIGELESQGIGGGGSGELSLPKNTARGLSATYDVNVGNTFGLEQVSPSGTIYNKPATRVFTSNVTGYFAIGKYTDNINFTDYITINPSGFVGINNTNPLVELDLNGDIACHNITGFIGYFDQIFANNISFSGAITDYIVAQALTGVVNYLNYTTGGSMQVNNFTGINIRAVNLTGINGNFINLFTNNSTGINLNYINITGTNANIRNITGSNLSITGLSSLNSITGNFAFFNNFTTNTFTGTNLRFNSLTGVNATITNITGTNLSITGTASINNITGNSSNFTTSTIDGNLYVNGDAYKPFSQFWKVASDRRVKKNIENINLQDCLESIQNIKLKKFNYISEYNIEHKTRDKKYIGVIADELEQTHPDSVINIDYQKIGSITFNNFKTIDTSQQFYELVGCVQYLLDEIASLKKQLHFH